MTNKPIRPQPFTPLTADPIGVEPPQPPNPSPTTDESVFPKPGDKQAPPTPPPGPTGSRP